MIYNNEKFKTYIEGLDLLFFNGIRLHSNCYEKNLTIVIQGEEGTYKSLLAMQLLMGISRSIKDLEDIQSRTMDLSPNKDNSIKLGKSIFYSKRKSKISLNDLAIDLLIAQCEEKVIKEGLSDTKKWNKRRFCSAFFKVDSSPSVSPQPLDQFLVDGLLHYNIRTNSLNLKKKTDSEDEKVIYERKYDNYEEYYQDTQIPDCFRVLMPNIELKEGESFSNSIEDEYIPCLVIQGEKSSSKIELPKSLVTIHVVNKDWDIESLNPDVVIRTRVKTTDTKYEIRQLSITKSTLQATAQGWHQYKKRSIGVMVFPGIYVLTHKRNFQSSFYRQTNKDILQQTFSQYVSKESYSQLDIDNLYQCYNSNTEERELKTLENLYNYSQKSDNVRKVLEKILCGNAADTENKKEAEAYLTAIIGKTNTYKRFIVSGSTFYESLNNENITLKVLLDKDRHIILRRMICPALMGMNNKIVDEKRLKKCRKCYQHIHFMNVDLRCTTADEFFFYLLKQLDVTYKNGKKISRIVIDDLQRIDHSFSQIKGNQSFLSALKEICKERNISVYVLCDENATMAHQLSVLADNVLFMKRIDFKSVQIHISRYSGHNQPNLIYACQIENMNKLFKCETDNSIQRFNIIDLSIKPIDNFEMISEHF